MRQLPCPELSGAALSRPETVETVAVAVSGGADSMALTLLADRWAKSKHLRLVALTVDHGLRPGSGREARQVGTWLARRGIEHTILRWRGPKPKTNRQALARAARYRLMASWLARHGVRHLLLGHQMEDQAETFLLRLARGSGVDGLSAMAPAVMAPVWPQGEILLLRPLLQIPKARLRATLQAQRQEWIEDPSNRDCSYGRVRMREAMGVLGELGLGPERLALTAAHMARARAALEADTGALLQRAARMDGGGSCALGYCTLDTAAFALAPQEIGLRALARLLMIIGAADYPPRLARLERLYFALIGRRSIRGQTLMGCVVAPVAKAKAVTICRESAAVAAQTRLEPGQSMLWDGRFWVGLRRNAIKGLSIRPLSTVRWPANLARPKGVPPGALGSLPALTKGRQVVAVPGLGFAAPGKLAQSAGFSAILAPRGWRQPNVATPD
jgi:tRNA(Ile)-lysidine synthase